MRALPPRKTFQLHDRALEAGQLRVCSDLFGTSVLWAEPHSIYMGRPRWDASEHLRGRYVDLMPQLMLVNSLL